MKHSPEESDASKYVRQLSDYDLGTMVEDHENSWFNQLPTRFQNMIGDAQIYSEAAKREIQRRARDRTQGEEQYTRNTRQHWKDHDEEAVAEAGREDKARLREEERRRKRDREQTKSHRRDKEDTERGMYNRKKKTRKKQSSPSPSPNSEGSWQQHHQYQHQYQHQHQQGPGPDGQRSNAPGEITADTNKNVFKELMRTYGVKGDLDKGGVRSVYRKLSVKLHPDKTGSDAAKEVDFKRLGESYAALKDLHLASRKKKKRRKKRRKKKSKSR
jgi:hypothetical protein